MMRGVNIFGRTKKSSSSSPTKRGTATITPGNNSTNAAAATQGRGAAGVAQPPQCAPRTGTGPVPPQRPPKRVDSPPALPVPLLPEPRLLRLFPEYEAYDEAVSQRQQQRRHEHNEPQQQPPSRDVAALPPPPAKQDTKVQQLPDGEKGLENNQGQYNCFINVVIQALWHLTAFRERFVRGRAEHCCPGPESCVHCALQAIFVEYQFSEQAIIPPTVLRQSLAVLYKDESRFQMNQIDDAAEALEAILDRLHQTERAHKDKNTDPAVLEKKACPCLVHNAFGVRTMDLLRCDSCAATTEPKATSLFVAYAYTYALREARAKAGNDNSSYSFCQFFQKAAQEDRRWCPNADRCNRMCVVEHHLLYLPKVFSVGLVWPSADGAPVNEIADVMDMITMEIDMSNIFITNTAIGRYLQQEKQSPRTTSTSGSLCDSLLGSGVLDSIALADTEPGARAANKKRSGRVKCIYELRGMICYYGQHYNCYFNSPATGQWYVFDDVMVNAVGSTWAAVKERCLRGHLQPSVLFYEKKEVVEDESVVEEERDGVTDETGPQPRIVEAHAVAASNEGLQAMERAAREVSEGGMEALKRTMEAEILELLLQGEEQWKRDREQERELARARELEERNRVRAEPQAEPVEPAVAVEPYDHHQDQGQRWYEDDGNEEEEEEEQTEVASEEEDAIQMNGSWFVRRTHAKPREEETETETETETTTAPAPAAVLMSEEPSQAPRAVVSDTHRPRALSTGDREATRRTSAAQPRSEEPEEDSEWEIIDDQGDGEGHHCTARHSTTRRHKGDQDYFEDDDDDDVEIIFENERERPHDDDDDDDGDGDGQSEDAGPRDGSESDDDCVEIVDEAVERGAGEEDEREEGEECRRERRRVRKGSSFTMLPSSESEGALDISFTMIDPDDPHGGGDEAAPLLEVIRTSWLYRRESSFYRLTAEELVRIEPDTHAIKESFRYDDMAQVLLYGASNMAIRFNTGENPHCIDGYGVERIAHVLCLRNPHITFTRQ